VQAIGKWRKNMAINKKITNLLLLGITLFAVIFLILLASALTSQEEIVDYNLINGGII
jgi:CHASE3 domain sensor protein